MTEWALNCVTYKVCTSKHGTLDTFTDFRKAKWFYQWACGGYPFERVYMAARIDDDAPWEIIMDN